MKIEPGNIIMSFGFDMIEYAFTNCFGIVYWNGFEDIRKNLCTVYAFQVINGKRYHCNFLMSAEMVRDTNFLHDTVRERMQYAFKNNIFTFQAAI